MDEISLKILKALSELKKPAGCGEIGKKADLPYKRSWENSDPFQRMGLLKAPLRVNM